MNKKELLTYVTSAVMTLLLIALMGYLTFIPVPGENKDIILTIMGVIVGGGASAMTKLFGDHDEETEKLKDRVRQLETKNAVQEAHYIELKQQYDRIVEMLIQRHVVGDNVDPDDSVQPQLPFIGSE